MTNKEIIQSFKLLVSLMELHNTDVTLIKPFTSALYRLDMLDKDLLINDLQGIQKAGFSKAIASKIADLMQTQTFAELTEYVQKTPPGLLEVLEIKGIGAKKVRLLWQEQGIEDLDGLREACEAGAVAKLKGLGEKTQQLILDNIAFFNKSSGKLLLSEAEPYQNFLLSWLESFEGASRVETSGQWRRCTEVVDTLSFVVQAESKTAFFTFLNSSERLSCTHQTPFVWEARLDERPALKVQVRWASAENFHKEWFLDTAADGHLFLPLSDEQPKNLYQLVCEQKTWDSEKAIYEAAQWPYLIPSQREGVHESLWIKEGNVPEAVQNQDLKGILHLHSTYSDGKHSLEDMAVFAKSLGYEYIGITDHSKTSFYANGLSEGRVRQQQEEIDQLNLKLAPFKIFKGIEVDILNDGQLDYDPETLQTFDFTIPSIHQNMRMPIDKATKRLLAAIENPFATIMGHLTGRLLLRREGYPVDFKQLIDACAANGVAIELNSSAYRLDLDWRWLPYAIEKGVWISLNPDAHNKEGYENMKYGVAMAQKAALKPSQTLNALNKEQLESYFVKRKAAIVLK